MVEKNKWGFVPVDLFQLDNFIKKKYNGNVKSTAEKGNNLPRQVHSGAVFSRQQISDDIAKKMIDVLYSDGVLANLTDFINKNGLPSREEREENKVLLGEDKERTQTLDLLKNKTNSILNPKLPNETDRAFLSGLMGDEEEELYFNKKVVKNANEKEALFDILRISPVESQSGVFNKPISQNRKTSPTIEHAILRNPNAKNEVEHAFLDPNKPSTLVQYAEKETNPASRKSLKDTLIDFLNNASAWANEKGVFDDITNAFFKAADLWQDYPIKRLPTDPAHQAIAIANYIVNQKIDLSAYETDGGYINDQNDRDSQASKIRYGSGTFYDNGCEIIAVNNALVSLGNRKDVRDIAKDFETNGQTLFGAFGTSPFAIDDYFKKQGYQVETFTGDKKIYSLDIPDADTYIVSFWNSDKITSAIHTVSVDKLPNGKYKIYNVGKSRTKEVDSLNAYFFEGNRVPLVLHCIKKGK